MRDAQHLHTMISNTSDLAEKVSSKVRLLDLVKVPLVTGPKDNY